MGRRLPRQLSSLGSRIYERMRTLNLETPEVAAAAGISSSTLYRIMRADRHGTVEPRLSTKRRLARALRLSMATLFEDEQLELVYEPVLQQPTSSRSVETLILHHLRTVPEGTRLHATRAAAFALVDLVLTVAGDNSDFGDVDLSAFTDVPSEKLLLMLLRRLPAKLQRVGAKAAISAMLKVDRLGGREASKSAYASIARTDWSETRLARDRPPLADFAR